MPNPHPQRKENLRAFQRLRMEACFRKGKNGIISAMKKAILTAVFAVAACAHGLVLDGIAAKVNDAVITSDDVNTAIGDMRRAGAAITSGTDFKTVYSNTVEFLIERRLILQLAAEKKITFPEWAVDGRIREIVKEKFDGDMNKLNAMLSQIKTPLTEWRNMIRDDMIITAMRQQFVEKNVTATPADMQREYRENKSRYRTEAKTSVRVILLRPSDASDKKTPSVTTRGEEILARLEKGEDFATLAQKYSADSHAKDGGLWKDVNPQEAFRPEIAKAIDSLKTGEFSKLVNLNGWGFIVRKESETAEKPLSFAEAYDQIERNLKRDLSKDEYRAWINRLREGAFIKVYPFPEEKR